MDHDRRWYGSLYALSRRPPTRAEKQSNEAFTRLSGPNHSSHTRPLQSQNANSFRCQKYISGQQEHILFLKEALHVTASIKLISRDKTIRWCPESPSKNENSHSYFDFSKYVIKSVTKRETLSVQRLETGGVRRRHERRWLCSWTNKVSPAPLSAFGVCISWQP